MHEFLRIRHGSMGNMVEWSAPKAIIFPDSKDDESGIEGRVSASIKERFVSDDIDLWLQRDIIQVSYFRQISCLIGGTLNLVNTVIDQHQREEPIDTLLFLDKSARSGAFLYRQMWSELRKRGEIPDGVLIPDIRFMNIESERDLHEFPEAILRRKYRGEAFEQRRVVVVDESVEHGKTLRTGLKVLEDVFGTLPIGMAQFQSNFFPVWCDSSETKGVAELVPNDESRPGYREVRDRLNELQFKDEEVGALLKIVGEVSETRFSEAVQEIKTFLDRAIHPETIHSHFKDCGLSRNEDWELEGIKLLCRLVWHVGLQAADGSNIWQYIDSAGGFVARTKDDNKVRRHFVYYRKVLKAMISIYMQERDREIENERTNTPAELSFQS